jgi:biopolymer transport protein ExbB/TolQ
MEGHTGLITGLAQAFSDGGFWMYAILAAHIVSIAIIVERFSVLFLAKQTNQKDIVKSFEDDIKKGRLETAFSKAQSISNSQPIGAVLTAGIQSAMDMGGREEIQAKMDEILSAENVKLERRTGFLAMLGNVGPLMGLLGTILGLIQAFSAVTNVNASDRAVKLTQGIALGMNTTAYGLIMAIPALVMYAIFVNRTTRLQDDLNQAAIKAFNWLSFNYDAIPQKRSRSQQKSL